VRASDNTITLIRSRASSCRQIIIKYYIKLLNVLILHVLPAMTFNTINVTTQCSSLCHVTFEINSAYLLEWHQLVCTVNTA